MFKNALLTRGGVCYSMDVMTGLCRVVTERKVKSMKRILSTVLALTLMLMIPVCAFAAIDPQYDTHYVTTYTDDEVIGNIWDTNVYYHLDRKKGLLTIYGNGAMSDCDKSPRFQDEVGREAGFAYYTFGNEIVDVVIEDGVTDIMSGCFMWCENLKTVTIPPSVTFIAMGCFDYCDAFSDIYYTGTVTQWNKVESGVRPTDKKKYRLSLNTPVHIMGSKTGWVTEKEKTYYLTEDNIVLYGLQEIGGKQYIFKKTTGELLKGKVSCDGTKYIMSKTDGRMLYGKIKCDGKYYIASKTDGRLLIYQYVSCNGKKYITGMTNGIVCCGMVRFNGKTYIASKTDGHLFLNATVQCDGHTYQTDARGAVIQ